MQAWFMSSACLWQISEFTETTYFLQMMTITGSFWGSKRINPRPQSQAQSGKLVEASCEQPLPNTLQLNIEGLMQSKICVISQLATKHKALVILLQETHCTTPDQQVIPNFKLAGQTMSRKHGLATFVHEGLSWTLADQFLDGSVVESLCVDVDCTKTAKVYKPPTTRFANDIISYPSVPTPLSLCRWF